MKRQRGNIILTALFITIFLFFLSVALIWTNRQDVALSLSVEHRLKAHSAARSIAYEAYGRLRKLGSLGSLQEQSFPTGATASVSLVRRLPGENANEPEMVLIRSKGQSGALTAYLTLHLVVSNIAGEPNASDPRVLFFPSPQQQTENGQTQEQSEASAKALFGDFQLADGGTVTVGMVANKGPVFRALQQNLPPPIFSDYLPVFSEDLQSVQAWGPLQVVGPANEEQTLSSTVIGQSEFKNDEFVWKEIPLPEDGKTEEFSTAQDFFLLRAPDNDIWNSASIQGVLDQVRSYTWTAPELPTQSLDQLATPPVSSAAEVPGTLQDWNVASGSQVQEKYYTRGAIFSIGTDLYSHGWHFLYQPMTSFSPGNVTAIDGARLTRWPCILRYSGSSWSPAWDPLKSDGSVTSMHRPDPDILLSVDGSTFFSLTEGEERRLLTLNSSGQASLGDEVAPGELVVYRSKVYLVADDQESLPGLTGLDGERIDFSGLPKLLPEISGEIVNPNAAQAVDPTQEVSAQVQPVDLENKIQATLFPHYDLRYTLEPGAQIAVDDDDLWATVRVSCQMLAPPEGSLELFRDIDSQPPIPEGEFRLLGRYDGQRWHILPNGLRAGLKSRLGGPGSGVIAALYPGLPSQVSRYTLVGVDKDPF